MNEYHKIDSVFKRDMESKYKKLIVGDYACEEFKYLAKNNWVWREKVDGTNIRIMIKDGRITFGGKTDNASIPAALNVRLQDIFLDQQGALLDAFPDGACLYGEGYGARIQKGGGNYRPDQDFVLFDVKIGHWWLKRESVEGIAKQFGLDIVPIIGVGTLDEMWKYTAEGFNSQWGPFLSEGIVATPVCDLTTRGGRRIITKVKHVDFN